MGGGGKGEDYFTLPSDHRSTSRADLMDWLATACEVGAVLRYIGAVTVTGLCVVSGDSPGDTHSRPAFAALGATDDKVERRCAHENNTDMTASNPLPLCEPRRFLCPD